MKLKHINTAPKDGSTIKVSDGKENYMAAWCRIENKWMGQSEAIIGRLFPLSGIVSWYEDTK